MNDNKIVEYTNETWLEPLGKILKDIRLMSITKPVVDKGNVVFPSKKLDDILRAFAVVNYNQLHTVILGQDPYPNVDRNGKPYATGIAFGIHKDNVGIPPSLQILDKAITKAYGSPISDYTLESVAKQGVLFLNSSLTVEKGIPHSHTEAWRWFIERVIGIFNNGAKDVGIIKMGKVAQSFDTQFATYSINCPHPASDSYNNTNLFYENEPFTRYNMWLEVHHGKKIKW